MQGMLQRSSWLANQPIHRKLILAFGLVLGLFLLSSYGSFKIMAQRSEARIWTVHTYAVIAQTLETELALRAQQNGVRGYLISAAPSQRALFDSGSKDFDRGLARLRALTADNPAQQHRLREIDDTVRGWRREAIAAIQWIGSSTAANSRTQSEEKAFSTAYMNRVAPMLSAIDAQFQDLEATERHLLAVRAAELERTVSNSQRALFALLLLGITVGLIAIYLAERLVALADQTDGRAHGAIGRRQSRHRSHAA